MGSHDISGLLNEVSLCIGQRIASGEDYSVLETAIKGNEEMIELRKNEILGKVAKIAWICLGKVAIAVVNHIA